MRFLVLFLFLVSCTNDPFDPIMGPRNPRAGAERYLLSRNDIQQSQKKALLDYEPCSLDVLRQLANARSPEIRSLVAANPSTDLPLFENLILDPDSAVRQYVASNHHTPHAILLKLKNDRDKDVRWVLPGNPNWSPDEIWQMYQDKVTAPGVFARNPNTPISILEELARSGDSGVDSALANNPSINDNIVKILVQSPFKSVRVMLTYNKATSVEVLESLTKDPDEEVRRYAVEWLSRRSERL